MEWGWDLCPWEGVVKDQRSGLSGNVLHQLRDQLGQKGSFRGECSRHNRQRAAQRVLATSLYSPTWDACLLVHTGVGPETWASADRLGKRTGVGWMQTAWRGLSEVQATWGALWVCQRGLTVNMHAKGRAGLPITASFSVWGSQRVRHNWSDLAGTNESVLFEHSARGTLGLTACVPRHG